MLQKLCALLIITLFSIISSSQEECKQKEKSTFTINCFGDVCYKQKDNSWKCYKEISSKVFLIDKVFLNRTTGTWVTVRSEISYNMTQEEIENSFLVKR